MTLISDTPFPTKHTARRRSGVLLLLLLCVIAACAPSSASESPTAEATAAQPVFALPTPTLYIAPTPPPEPTPLCPGAPKERLILQERGIVLPDDPRPVNLRSAAGTDNTVLMRIPIRSIFYVIDGPVCSDDFTWYKIRYEGREGWIAEGDLTSYYVEPYLPG